MTNSLISQIQNEKQSSTQSILQDTKSPPENIRQQMIYSNNLTKKLNTNYNKGEKK